MNPSIIKKQIQQTFERAEATYDNYCQIQKMACEKALKFLEKKQCKTTQILELACGTGVSTELLVEQFPESQIIAMDFVVSFLKRAKNKPGLKNVEFVCADFDKIPLQKPVNLICCNMGLQWTIHLSDSLQAIQKIMQKNGYFLFTVPLAGHFKEIKSDFRNTFWSVKEISDSLQKQGLLIIEHDIFNIAQDFESPFDIVKSIRNIGANYCFTEKSNKSLKKDFGRIFTKEHNKQLSHQIGIFLAKKER